MAVVLSGDWRMVQVFMSRHGYRIFEMYFNGRTSDLRCTCPGFRLRGDCKHARYLRGDGDESEAYRIALDRQPTSKVINDPEAFRLWVLHYGRPVVLP